MNASKLTEQAKEIISNVIGKVRGFAGRAREPENGYYYRTIKEEVSFKDGEKQRAGWVSPVYSKSRAINLDLRVLADNRVVAGLPNAKETEAYKVLRAQVLQRMKEKGGISLMITSCLPGEGKTLTAVNLACAMARDFQQTVLLVDCDLRKQDVHQVLGIESTKGIIDCLLDNSPVSDVMMWPGIEKLTVISGGKVTKDSTELIGSPAMKELVLDMKNRYPDRYVLFDVPPVLTTADAVVFAPLVDFVLLVVRWGVTPMSDLRRVLELIPAEKILGLVLNGDTTPVRVY